MSHEFTGVTVKSMNIILTRFIYSIIHGVNFKAYRMHQLFSGPEGTEFSQTPTSTVAHRTITCCLEIFSIQWEGPVSDDELNNVA